jgi:hypothetical protein
MEDETHEKATRFFRYSSLITACQPSPTATVSLGTASPSQPTLTSTPKEAPEIEEKAITVPSEREYDSSPRWKEIV